MKGLLEYLRGFELTRMEKLQVLNILPRNLVEFYAVVEECEERFSPDQIDQILNTIDQMFPLPDTTL